MPDQNASYRSTSIMTAVSYQSRSNVHTSYHENLELRSHTSTKKQINDGMIDATYIAETAGQEEKLPYPKSVYFILGNEFCERFNYFGMRTILVLHLSRQLGYSDDKAMVIFHVFTMFVYFLCVFGAIISDSWLGKFKTILYMSLVYVCGSIMMTLGAIPQVPGKILTMFGLSLIALGSGGIKPCVSAFGGDQFKLPEQVKQMTTFFSLFYYTINAGSLISTLVTPIMREDVHCFGEKQCDSLAFGVPAVLMAVSIVVFFLGRSFYKSKPPAGNMVVLVSQTIGNAISTSWREKKTEPREHWLDYAYQKYDRQLIEDVKVLMRVLVLYLPLPMFWALFAQQGSRWTFQASRMDGDMGSWDIKPDQLQVLNSVLTLIFISFCDVAFYPALNWIGIRRPLQKMTLGGILAVVAFLISGIVELNLEKTYPTLPEPYMAQLRIFNGEYCNYTFTTNLPDAQQFTIGAISYYENKLIRTAENGIQNFEYSIRASGANCFDFGRSTFTYQLEEKKAHSLFMSSHNPNGPLTWYEDFVNKPLKGKPLVRTLANLPDNPKITWHTEKKNVTVYEKTGAMQDLTEFDATSYRIYVNDIPSSHTETLRTGGVYTLLIGENIINDLTIIYLYNCIELTPPNSMNVLWLIPQYLILTLGEVMFSVTALKFLYSQAPITMKSVLEACWQLTVAFGNLIVVIIAEANPFDSQASEFFLFAGLMFIAVILFMFMAYRYKPYNPSE